MTSSSSSSGTRRNDVRNLSIIAHVDHGKTTLVDGLLRVCRVFRENQQVAERFLDSNDQERERGITIYAKNIALNYGGVKLNVIDTPGHADFGGEVERILSMCDGALLLVDAYEGPMPQTRFVLQKAFLHGLKVMVVVNKIDRPDARPHDVLDEVFDLFCELDASDEQLEFPVVYCSARDGFAALEPDGERRGLEVMLDEMLKHIPGPEVKPDEPFRCQVTKIDYDRYVGRVAVGRVRSGSLEAGAPVAVTRPDAAPRIMPAKQLQVFEAMQRVDVPRVQAGDVAALIGLDNVAIGDTVCDAEHPDPLPVVPIDEPTVSMVFSVNDGPFGGKVGEFVTSRHIRDRLHREALHNVALRVDEGPTAESVKVSGRGVMHLGVVVETMRREGYEFCVSRPEVILKEFDGKLHEPVERLVVNVPEANSGKAMELIGQRRGEMIDMSQRGNLQTISFRVPARGLLGLRTRLLTATNGEATMYHVFHGWEPFKGEIATRTRGVLIAMETEAATAYALNALKDRGTLFVDPGTACYEGMIVGEHSRDNDLDVNVSRKKQLTNMRAAGSDDNVHLPPARTFTVEEALEYIADDELVEFTPKDIRLRKRALNETERRRQARAARDRARSGTTASR